MAPRRRTRLALAAFAVAVGCSTYTRGIRPSTNVNTQASAYLYGRFAFKVHEAPYGVNRNQTMGLQIYCADGQTYTFRFLHNRDVQVIQAAPSTCWLFAVVLTGRGEFSPHRVDPASVRPMTFAAGHAYYLGDYFAAGDLESAWKFAYTVRHWTWYMSPADDRYESTTAEMKRMFAALAWLPTEEMRLIPPAHQPKPGAVVIKDPNEPLMTPERIARVAPLVKRTYASPPECEAACPTGECLPFRGEAGPAMTCINRCNSDKDCPEGLACNCPGAAAGAGCQAIAETPGDSLAKICLSVERGGQRR